MTTCPRAYNPKNGFVVTANQNPFPADFKYRVNGRYCIAVPILAHPWSTLAAGGGKLRPEDNLRIQKDVYSAFDRFLAQQVAKAYASRAGPRIRCWAKSSRC